LRKNGVYKDEQTKLAEKLAKLQEKGKLSEEQVTKIKAIAAKAKEQNVELDLKYDNLEEQIKKLKEKDIVSAEQAEKLQTMLDKSKEEKKKLEQERLASVADYQKKLDDWVKKDKVSTEQAKKL
jgi:hypothetical protein